MDTMTEPSLRNALSCDRCGEWFFTETITRGPIACPICTGKVTSRRVVSVEVIDGIVTLAIDSAKCAALSAKRLPEIERSEQLRDELSRRLTEIFAPERAKRRTGEWMPHSDYLRLQECYRLGAAIRHAMALKVPRNRVKALEKIAKDIEGWSK